VDVDERAGRDILGRVPDGLAVLRDCLAISDVRDGDLVSESDVFGYFDGSLLVTDGDRNGLAGRNVTKRCRDVIY